MIITTSKKQREKRRGALARRWSKKREIELRCWMLRQGVTQTLVAKKTGVFVQVVHETIRGGRNDKKVLGYLKQKGCPDRLLGVG